MNPVEVLFAAFPMLLYFDSSLGGLLLEPLLRSQAWPNVNQQYASRDAGKIIFFVFPVHGAPLHKFIIRNVVPECLDLQ